MRVVHHEQTVLVSWAEVGKKVIPNLLVAQRIESTSIKYPNVSAVDAVHSLIGIDATVVVQQATTLVKQSHTKDWRCAALVGNRAKYNGIPI